MREFLPIENSEYAKKELADSVNAYLERHTQCETQILSLPMKTKRELRYLSAAVSFAALIVVSSIAVRAEAPSLQETGRPAKITLQSNKWLYAELNGKPVGYAPVVLRNLLPGSHRLRWRTGKKSGLLRLQLKPGEHLRLSESFLVKKGKVIKH